MGLIEHNLYRLSNRRLLSFVKKENIYPFYHIIKDENVAHIENLYEYKNSTQFKEDLEFLLKNYTPINPRDLFEKQNSSNSFLISFDDGLEEIYSVVFPILKEKNIKAVFFINPDFVDNNDILYKHSISIIISHLKKVEFNADVLIKINEILLINYSSNSEFVKKLKNIKYSDRYKINEVLDILKINIKDYLKQHKPYISTEQIKEMIDEGFYFGGHTMSHAPLNQLSFEEQKAEIINSIEWLKSHFNINYSLFAFPFSDKTVSKKLLFELFAYDKNILLFGNSGLKKDCDERIIQRFSFENPKKKAEKQVVAEHVYKFLYKLIGKYHIKRI